jgi:hypothetical protein
MEGALGPHTYVRCENTVVAFYNTSLLDFFLFKHSLKNRILLGS